MFDKYKKEKRITVLAGPYDCPSGSRVILDIPMDEELLTKDRAVIKQNARKLKALYDMVAQLRKRGAECGESVTVKVTFLSKPTPEK